MIYLFTAQKSGVYNSMGSYIFSIFYDFCQLCRRHEDNAITFKRKALWSLGLGFARFGVYWFS